MSFQFLSPQLLGLLALVGLPILLHLVARARPPVYEFPSLRLLREINRKTLRVKRPRDWLVLLLRSLALLALAAAFLRPLLLGKQTLASAEVQKTVVLVIDRSASMACREGIQTRFAKACQKGGELLEAAGANALANLVWITATPESTFPEPSPNRAYLVETLGKSGALPQTGSIESALRLAYDQLRDQPGAKEVFVISDFQAAAWKEIRFTPPTGIQVMTVPVAENPVANLAIASLRCEPAEPVVGQPVEIFCRVRNFSAEARRAELFIEAGDHRQNRIIDLPPWGETESLLSLVLPQVGVIPVKAQLEVDGFPGDDVRHTLLSVKESIRLAVVAESNAATEVEPLLALGDSISWLRTRLVSPAEALKADAELFYLHQWPGQSTAEWLARSRQTPVIVQPKWDLAISSVEELLGLNLSNATLRPETQTEKGWRMQLQQDAHPSVSLFKNGEFGSPFEGQFFMRTRWEGSWPKERVIATYQDGVPALLQAGSVSLWNFSPAPEVSTWATESGFVSFMGEWIRTSLPKRTGLQRDVLPGMAAVFQPTLEVDPASVDLINEQQKPLPLQGLTGGGGLQSPPLTPGLYRWRSGGATLDWAVCPFPETESDLRYLAPEQLSAPSLWETDAKSLAAERDGTSLWPWLMILTGACFLGELGVLWFTRTKPTPQEKEAPP
jgi:hypothetical protein